MIIDSKNEFFEISSSDLKVGHIVLMREGETFPADLAVLSTSNSGFCFI